MIQLHLTLQGLARRLHGRGERFPALKAAVDSAVAQGAQDQAFDFGLARILDGVGLLIDSRAQPPSQP